MDLFPRNQYSDIPTNLKPCSEMSECFSRKVFGMYVGIFGGIFVLLGIGVWYWWNWDDDDGGLSGITLKIGRWFGKIGEQRRKKKEEGKMARKAKEEREKVGVEERAKEEGLAADMNGEEEANERQESIWSDETLDEPAMPFTRIQKLIRRPFRLTIFPTDQSRHRTSRKT